MPGIKPGMTCKSAMRASRTKLMDVMPGLVPGIQKPKAQAQKRAAFIRLRMNFGAR
jgi:hypothetical protein